MAIYNLGTLERARPEVNPYMEMMMNAQLKNKEIASRERLAREESSRTLLAKTELERTDATRKNLTATWQSLSDKPATEQKLFLDSDKGKEYLKTVKKYIPEVFDDNGEPILFPSTKDTIKQKLDERIATTKNKLLTEGPESLSAGESATLQMEGYKDIVTEALSIVMKSPDYAYYSQSDKPEDIKIAQNMFANTLKMLKSQRDVKGNSGMGVNDFSGAISGNQESATSIAEQATPKATRFKVRKL